MPPVRLIDPARAAALDRAQFSYPEIAATADTVPPPGYRSIRRSATLPSGTDLDAVARDLFGWQVQHRAGLAVASSHLPLVEGTVVELGLGAGRRVLWLATCRVVYVLDEPDRRGFAYGTLPGHPESGEEAFVLERGADGRITFTVSAFSRPATPLARWSGPLGRAVQDAMTARYLRTLG